MNTLLIEMIDSSVQGLVQEWTTFDHELYSPKVEICRLTLISASWSDPVRQGEKNLTRSRLTTNYNRTETISRFVLDQRRDMVIFLTKEKWHGYAVPCARLQTQW